MRTLGYKDTGNKIFRYERGLTSMIYISFGNKTKGNKDQNTEHNKLANNRLANKPEEFNQKTKNVAKTKLITTSVDKLLCTDPKDMQLLSIKKNSTS